MAEAASLVSMGDIRLESAFPEIDRIREKSLEAFVRKLIEREGGNLLRVTLFGSVARGDAREDSDTDVFVLLRKGERASLDDCDRVSDAATDTNLAEGECRTYISAMTYSLKEYQEYSWMPLFDDIKEEGVVLYAAE